VGTSTSNMTKVLIDRELGPSQYSGDYRSWTLTGLTAGTYYWKVTSRTMANLERTSATFSFTVGTVSAGGALPSGWSNRDIGSVSAAGSASYSGGTFTVSGSGADIWGTADAFHYMFTSVGSDVTMTARVTSLSNTNAWSKAGVMMRESLAPGSRDVMVIVSPGRGVAMQYRGTAGGISANVALHSGAAPTWVRLRRSGNTFIGYSSTDGVGWTALGSVSLSLPYGYFVGVPVTAHDNTAIATATLEESRIDAF
jgi:hypothetical protein